MVSSPRGGGGKEPTEEGKRREKSQLLLPGEERGVYNHSGGEDKACWIMDCVLKGERGSESGPYKKKRGKKKKNAKQRPQ